MKEPSSIEDTIHKLVPPILLACVFALTQAYILTGQNRDKMDRLEATDRKQWDIISENKSIMLQLRTEQKHNLTKEEYYKDRK